MGSLDYILRHVSTDVLISSAAVLFPMVAHQIHVGLIHSVARIKNDSVRSVAGTVVRAIEQGASSLDKPAKRAKAIETMHRYFPCVPEYILSDAIEAAVGEMKAGAQ